MKVAGKLLALILSALLLCAALPAWAADYVEGEVLVLTKSSGAATAAANLSAAGAAASRTDARPGSCMAGSGTGAVCVSGAVILRRCV